MRNRMTVCTLGLLAWGCSSQPSSRSPTHLDKAAVAARVQDASHFQQVQLHEVGSNTYEGTGKDKEGTIYSLEVIVRDPNNLHWEAQDPKTGRKQGGDDFRK